jgi:uncharacterized membrane protein
MLNRLTDPLFLLKSFVISTVLTIIALVLLDLKVPPSVVIAATFAVTFSLGALLGRTP